MAQDGDVREWRIHLGAHKTATTHVQDTLEALRPRLADSGTDYLPRNAIRGPMNLALSRRNWRTYLAGAPMRRQLEGVLSARRSGLPVVLLSEENILGLCGDALAMQPYPQLSRRVRAVASLGGGARLHLFLTIRSFDRFFPAAYAEALRFRQLSPQSFADFRRRLSARPPSWVDIVARVRRAAPGVPLRIWCQEDYRDHDKAILEALAGHALPPLPDLPPPPDTITPSGAAVAEIEANFDREAGPGWTEYVREVYRRLPAGPDRPRFAPLTPDEVARLRSRYAEDLDVIDRGDPEMRVRV